MNLLSTVRSLFASATGWVALGKKARTGAASGLPAVLAVGWPGFPLHPPAASTIAQHVDYLFYFLTAVTLFFTILIFGLIFYFMIKYRRRSDDEKPPVVKTSTALEVTWTAIPTVICAVMFIWSSSLFFQNSRPPKSSMEIFVIGKQWMWQLQHPEGPREINELHVPVGVPVKLTMTSQDVIHGFYIPAFRIKKDVLPGRYASLWFQATKVGDYHLFCSQYCGAGHSAMIGWVHVMKDQDFARWLQAASDGDSMASAGAKLFTQLGCDTCHLANNTGRSPSLVGLYGRQVKLRDGSTVTADESYIRDAIVHANAKPLPGYDPVMPSFQGQIDEQQLLQLVAYVKSLGTSERTQQGK